MTDPIATSATATARAKDIGDLMAVLFLDEENLGIALTSGSTADSVSPFHWRKTGGRQAPENKRDETGSGSDETGTSTLRIAQTTKRIAKYTLRNSASESRRQRPIRGRAPLASPGIPNAQAS